MKKMMMLFVLMFGLISLIGCSDDIDSNTSSQNHLSDVSEQNEILLTLEQLKQFDGLDGRKAYIAVNGVIYDVTDSFRWRSGTHNGFRAGQDLTNEILRDSPHGISVLSRMPVVGRIIEEGN